MIFLKVRKFYCIKEKPINKIFLNDPKFSNLQTIRNYLQDAFKSPQIQKLTYQQKVFIQYLDINSQMQ